MGGRAAVIMVLGFAAIFAMIQYRLSEVGTEATDNMIAYHEQTARHYVALAGANFGLSTVYQNPTFRGVLASDRSYYGGSFSARFDSVKLDTFRLTSIGLYNGKTDTVLVDLFLRTPSSYTQFVLFSSANSNNRFFITGDTLGGKVHVDDKINILGSPVFLEKVTTTQGFNPPPGVPPNNAVYNGGYETGVAPIGMVSNLNEQKNAAIGGGYYTTGQVWLRLDSKTALNNDGMIYVYSSSVMTPPNLIDSVLLVDPTFNGVFYSEDMIHLRGSLDGIATIVSGKSIWLDDNVVYADRNINTDDLLGIVAEKDVIITDNVPNDTHIEIDAALFARSGSFNAENYVTRGIDGFVRVWGAIAQGNWGFLAHYAGYTLQSGFYRRFLHDDRFDNPNFKPPYYPTFEQKTMQIVSWWE